MCKMPALLPNPLPLHLLHSRDPRLCGLMSRLSSKGHIPAAAIILNLSFNTVLMHPHTGLKTSSLRPLTSKYMLYCTLNHTVAFGLRFGVGLFEPLMK